MPLRNPRHRGRTGNLGSTRVGQKHGASTKRRGQVADVPASRVEDIEDRLALSGVQIEKTVFNNAEIKGLPSSGGYEIVPSPGPGKSIIPLWMHLLCDTTNGVYTNINAASTLREVNNRFGKLEEGGTASAKVSRLLANGDPSVALLLPFMTVTGSFVTGYASFDENFSGALYLESNNGGSGNFTGGHADNILEVRVAYMVLEL